MDVFLRRLAWCGLAMLLMTNAARAAGAMKPSVPAARTEIHAVVQAQLQALRDGAFPAAYALAAEGIREKFTLEAFVKMVQGTYPELARHVRAELGSAVDDGSAAMISVRVTLRDGSSVRYRYLLQREAAGWRISGVVGEKRPLNEV